MEGSSYLYLPREAKLEVIDKNKMIDIVCKEYDALIELLKLPPSYFYNLKNNSSYMDIIKESKISRYFHESEKVPNFYYVNIQQDNKLIVAFDKTVDEIKKLVGFSEDGGSFKCNCSDCKNKLTKGSKVFIADRQIFCSQKCAALTGNSRGEYGILTKTMKEWNEALNKFKKIVKDNPDVFDSICTSVGEDGPLGSNSKYGKITATVKLNLYKKG